MGKTKPIGTRWEEDDLAYIRERSKIHSPQAILYMLCRMYVKSAGAFKLEQCEVKEGAVKEEVKIDYGNNAIIGGPVRMIGESSVDYGARKSQWKIDQLQNKK